MQKRGNKGKKQILIFPLCKGGLRGISILELMLLKYNGKLKSAARELRKNMTDAEKLLWLKIKGKQIKGVHFYRQKTIGNFIVDFY